MSAAVVAKPPHGLGRCYECAAELPPGVEIARCFPCHKRHDPEARDLVPVVPFPLVVHVEALNPIEGPASIETDAARCIGSDLAVLRVVVAAYSELWHIDGRAHEAAILGERVEELLDRLKACGCDVRVVAAS